MPKQSPRQIEVRGANLLLRASGLVLRMKVYASLPPWALRAVLEGRALPSEGRSQDCRPGRGGSERDAGDDGRAQGGTRKVNFYRVRP